MASSESLDKINVLSKEERNLLALDSQNSAYGHSSTLIDLVKCGRPTYDFSDLSQEETLAGSISMVDYVYYSWLANSLADMRIVNFWKYSYCKKYILLISFVLFCIGSILLLDSYYFVKRFSTLYDSKLDIFYLNVSSTMKPPIYAYVEINDLYSNHHKFASSKPSEIFGPGYKCNEFKNIASLVKERADLKKMFLKYYEVETVEDRESFKKIFLKKKLLLSDFITCGFSLLSIFNDRIVLKLNGTVIPIDDNYIEPETEYAMGILEHYRRRLVNQFFQKNLTIFTPGTKNTNFRKISATNIKLFYNQQAKENIFRINKNIASWWKARISNSFDHIYGKLDIDPNKYLESGVYQVQIKENNLPAGKWGFSKKFVLSSTGYFGGTQYFIAFFCYVISLMYFAIYLYSPFRIVNYIVRRFQGGKIILG